MSITVVGNYLKNKRRKIKEYWNIQKLKIKLKFQNRKNYKNLNTWDSCS